VQHFDDFQAGVNFVAQQSGCGAIAVSNFKFSKVSPDARKLKVANNLCFSDIASLILVSSLCTRDAVNSNNSPNADGHIRK
jgi:hypothetical protein